MRTHLTSKEWNDVESWVAHYIGHPSFKSSTSGDLAQLILSSVLSSSTDLARVPGDDLLAEVKKLVTYRRKVRRRELHRERARRLSVARRAKLGGAA